MKKLLVCLLFAVLLISCLSNFSRENPNVDKYFVVTQECSVGQSVGQENYRKVYPCEYFSVLGTVEDGGQKYHTIQINNSSYFINDKYGSIAWGTANISFICEQSKKPKKPLIIEVKKKETGPFLFEIKDLRNQDDTRELELYTRDGFDRYYVLERNCTYDAELRFTCIDDAAKAAKYYVPGIIPPNKFNISEYRYFGKFTETGLYCELDRLTRQKWEADQKEQQQLEEKRLRAEKEKEKARIKKEEENRIAKLDLLRSAGCPLAIESWSWSRSSDYYVTVKGKVMNLTGNRITHIKVHVEIFDKGGNFITSGWNYLEYPVLMPYQSSPFQIVERWNPLMTKASIRIQMPTGEMIQGSCAMGK